MNRRRASSLIFRGGLATAVVTALGCDKFQSPAAPAPLPSATLSRAENNIFEVVANVKFESVLEALQSVGLDLEVKDGSDWETTAGTRFSGSFIKSISDKNGHGGKNNWLISINDVEPCTNVRGQEVSKNSKVTCFVPFGPQKPLPCEI